MAISEVTKTACANRRAAIKSQLQRLDAEIVEHQASLNTLQTMRDTLKAESDALTADVPEPTKGQI